MENKNENDTKAKNAETVVCYNKNKNEDKSIVSSDHPS